MKTARGVIPLIAVVVSVAVLGWSFVAGIFAAFDPNGLGALPYTIAFFVALLVVWASAIVAIVNLVRKRFIALAVVTLVISAVPVITVLAVIAVLGDWMTNRLSVAG